MTYTTTTTTDALRADYLARCEEHLGDLPTPIRAQLRQDVAEIVDEVCGELGGSPAELVGPPARFVGELRAAAGWPLPEAGPTPPAAAGADPSLRHLLRAARDHRAVRWTQALVPELRPAWWVARGYLVAVAVGRLTGAPRRPEWLVGLAPYWPVLGSRLLGLAAVAAAIYFSVEAGRRPLSGRRRLGRAVASAVALVTALALAGAVESRMTRSGGYSMGPGPFVHDHAPAVDDGPPFEAVHIGSDVTGDRIEVLDLASAEGVLDRMLREGPPASIYIERGGERSRPGNLENWRFSLQALVEEGALNPAPSSSVASE